MSTPSFDRNEMLRAAELLIEPGAVTELRALDAQLRGQQRTGTVSGYFDSPAKLVAATARIVAAKGIYIGANPVQPDLLARAANRVRLVNRGEPLTADHDVPQRRWLLIDVDPQRPAGISSNQAEHDAAKTRAESIRALLRDDGWPEPVLADSGNGWHLLYRIDLPASDGGLVQRVLQALATRFDDDAVKVDTSVYNPARIWKLYGTVACKGDHTPERPHRLARIVERPAVLEVVPEAKLAALAAPTQSKSQSAKPSAHGKGGSTFDLTGWLGRHFSDATGPKDWNHGGQMWELPVCPFNPDHLRSAYVGRQPGGAIVAGCHHNSCSHWGWSELRAKCGDASSPRDGGDSGGGGDKESGTRAEQTVRLVLESCRLGRSLKNELFAVWNGGPNIALPLGKAGCPFNDKLAREVRRKTGKVLSQSMYSDCIAAIRGEAMERPAEEVHLRVGPWQSGIVLDLGTVDGAAVVIDATGWRVVARSPILFRRTSLTGALPTPERGGSVQQLRDLINVTDETWPIFLGWTVCALIPNVPHPILMLGGQQGSGKTTAARFVCGVFDPSDAPTRSQPRDPEAWAISLSAGWTAVIDNISNIPDWWSDALCKAVTGDGWVRRELWTDCGVSILSYRRVIALTSIDAGALRGDLGERVVLVDLKPISPEQRTTERELEAKYAAARPLILGALLDLLSAVLARLDSVRLTQLPRMADFSRVLAAMDEAIGTHAMTIYADQERRIASEVVEADPVGEAIRRFMEGRAEWSGTAGKLFEAIKPPDRSPDWPKNGRGLASRLKRLAPALATQGILVAFPLPNDKRRQYSLRSTAQTARPPERPGGGGASGGDGAHADAAKPAEVGAPPDPIAEVEAFLAGRLGGVGGRIAQSDPVGDGTRDGTGTDEREVPPV